MKRTDVILTTCEAICAVYSRVNQAWLVLFGTRISDASILAIRPTRADAVDYLTRELACTVKEA
jgi:hypothetical protein